MRTALAGASAVVALILLAACTSGGDGAAESSAAPTPTPTTSSPVVSTPAPTPSSTAAPSTSSTAPSSTASSSAANTPPAFTTTCTDVGVRVIKGGAIRGAEIAALQFVNQGTTACTITGTPTAVLLRNGKVVGTPSVANRATVRPFTLQPGDTGESLLRDFSTCNAPLSDNLQLVTPTHNGKAGRTVTEPVTLRACDLEVAPVGPPA